MNLVNFQPAYRQTKGITHWLHRHLSILTLTLSAICLGCGSSDAPKPEQEPAEIKINKGLPTDAPESEVFRAATHLYEAGMYSVAKDSFDSLRDNFPLGAYASFAAIKSADCQFFTRDFLSAGKTYEEFLKNYPAGPESSYVRLQAARSYVLSNKGIGRDRAPLERALALLDQIIQQDPNSGFAKVASQERAEVVDRLAEYDKVVIDFYKKQDNQAAVDARQKEFNEKWGSELRVAAEIKDAPAQIPMKPLNVDQQELARYSTAPSIGDSHFESHPKEAKQAAIVGPRIQRVVCHSGDDPFALLEISGMSDAQFNKIETRVIAPENGIVKVNLGTYYGAESPIECFGGLNMQISEEGRVEIKSDVPLSLSTVGDPNRILIAQ